MIAVLVLSFSVTVFASLYPAAMRLRSKSENVTRATALCQQVIEKLRGVPYASLSYAGLRVSPSVIDASPAASPYSITAVESLASQLPQGTGTLALSALSSDLTRVDVTISWGGLVQNGNTVTLSTLIANKAVK
jgi:hypothetical protein